MNFFPIKVLKADPEQLKVEREFFFGDRVVVLKGFYKGLRGRLTGQVRAPTPVFLLELEKAGTIEISPEYIELIARRQNEHKS